MHVLQLGSSATLAILGPLNFRFSLSERQLERESTSWDLTMDRTRSIAELASIVPSTFKQEEVGQLSGTTFAASHDLASSVMNFPDVGLLGGGPSSTSLLFFMFSALF